MSPAGRVDLVVQGDRIVTATDVFDGGIAIKDGRIAALGPVDMLPDAAQAIDARGKIVFPGAIDCHVHLGTEYDDFLHRITRRARLAGLLMTPDAAFGHDRRGTPETSRERGPMAVPRAGQRRSVPCRRDRRVPDPRCACRK